MRFGLEGSLIFARANQRLMLCFHLLHVLFAVKPYYDKCFLIRTNHMYVCRPVAT
uniref:Uncharacterized protein n=1 Tax=Populus trichocarpa TaxID=3694 RepID=A9P8C4_POPTR|nr:unknown [Populus trichocarpa]ABK93634.1 unknown [Populus trichocarpa]ABK93658.1 unknown [Populus trichocarpa]